MSLDPKEIKILLDMNGELKGLHAKLDDALYTMAAQRTEQRVICDRSFSAIKDLDSRTTSLETTRDKAMGAAKLFGLTAAAGGAIGSSWPMIEWLRKFCKR